MLLDLEPKNDTERKIYEAAAPLLNIESIDILERASTYEPVDSRTSQVIILQYHSISSLIAKPDCERKAANRSIHY